MCAANTECFEEVLKKINRFITLKPEDRSTYAQDFVAVRDFLLREMQKNDDVFRALYKGPNLGGSYADNLKISTPDEYDLVFRLKISPSDLVRVERDPQRPGNVIINISNVIKKIEKEIQNRNVHKQLLKFVDGKGFLLQNKVQSWIEGIVTVIMRQHSNTFKSGGKIYNLDYGKSGPAHTLYISVENRKLSIDFVPGFIFGKEKWTAKRKCPPTAQKTDWLAIPKPIKSCSGPNRSFRASFVDTEQDFINNKFNLKNTLRMLKKMRDAQNIQRLKSYFIKTIFLWESTVVPDSYWSNSTSEVLLHMFEVLLSYVEKRNMPFFWDDKCNMFSDLTENQLFTMYHQLKSCYDSLKECKDKSPERALRIFLTQDEINSMNSGETIEEATKKKTYSSCIIA